MTVREIIKDCGGAISVADASQRTASRVTYEAVFKWYRNGIPEAHWPLVMEMSGRSVDQIYQANRIAERVLQEKRRKSVRRRGRQKKRASEVQDAA